MNFRIVKPGGLLKYYIKQYCLMESSILESDVTERVIPTDSVQLMFHYKNPFVVVHGDESRVRQPRSIISGLSDTFSDVSTAGESGVVFVSFYPSGACHFFRFPLSEVENQSIDLADVLGPEIGHIEEQLFLARSVDEKIRVIEDFLLRRFSPIPQHDGMLIRSGIELIKASKGQTSASTLSNQLSMTTKTLERKFAQYLGKTTKQVIKLIRFQEVLNDFSANKNLSLTEHAFNHGYFDQSHFIRDFRTYSGYTPGEFVARYPDFEMNPD